MDLGSYSTSTLVVVALGIAVLAVVVAVGGYLRLSGIQARYRILWAGYATGVLGGISHTTMTPEEQQALAAARTGKSDE